MSSGAEIVQTVLLAGTWSKFTWGTTTEGVYIVGQESVWSKEEKIELIDEEGGELIQSSDGTVIYQTSLCILVIFVRNRTDRDNMFSDIKTILTAYTGNSFTFKGFSYENPKKNRLKMKFTIEVL